MDTAAAADTQAEVLIINIKDISGGGFDENCLIIATGGDAVSEVSWMTTFHSQRLRLLRVYLDGVEISKHLAEREALESLSNAVLANPTSDAYVDHDYRVEADMGTGENTGENTGVVLGQKAVRSFLLRPAFVITDGTQTQNRVDVTWTAPLQGRATEYRVKDSTGTLGTVSWPATGMTVTGLTPATSYTLWVVTSDGITESAASNQDSFNTNPASGFQAQYFGTLTIRHIR